MNRSKTTTQCNDSSINGYPCFVNAQKILHLISSKWGIQMIYLLRDKKRIRYTDLRGELQKGWKKDKISDATLSTRLKEFIELGLLQKKVYPELPPKVEYKLSKKGEKLSAILEPLVEWAIQICHNENQEIK